MPPWECATFEVVGAIFEDRLGEGALSPITLPETGGFAVDMPAKLAASTDSERAQQAPPSPWRRVPRRRSDSASMRSAAPASSALGTPRGDRTLRTMPIARFR